MLEILEQFKKVPDWNRFPLPEIIYEKYGIKKPKPAEIMEVLTYNPPPAAYEKTETREPAPGGVRDLSGALLSLPTELEFTPDMSLPQNKDEAISYTIRRALGADLSNWRDSPALTFGSTKSTETKIRVLEGQSNPPEPDAVKDTALSEPHRDAE